MHRHDSNDTTNKLCTHAERRCFACGCSGTTQTTKAGTTAASIMNSGIQPREHGSIGCSRTTSSPSCATPLESCCPGSSRITVRHRSLHLALHRHLVANHFCVGPLFPIHRLRNLRVSSLGTQAKTTRQGQASKRTNPRQVAQRRTPPCPR